MNHHEEYRELLALRLYGECDEREGARLDAHLAECEDCRRFARDLDAGLGRVAARADGDDLPPGWLERVSAAAREERPARRGAAWWAAAAGFLIGLATMALVRTGPRESGAPGERSVVREERARPAGDVPVSTAGPGPLARLAAQRRG